MTSSHDEDLIFFGESLAAVEEGAPKESFLQKAKLDWKGKGYLLEADYDWEEKSVCTCLFRNDSLILYQPAELNSSELNLPLAEQVQTALQREKESLQAAFRLAQLVSEDWHLLNGLGLFFYSQNLWPEAEEFLSGAIRIRADSSEAYQNLSQVYLKMGLPEKSVKLLEQAVQLSDLLKEMGIGAEIKIDKSNEPVLKNLDQMSFAPDPNKPVVVHKFVHEFSDGDALGDFQADGNPPRGATIRFDLEGENLWLSCNRAGWQHLARICAEMGMHSEFEHGTHFHMPYDWQGSHSLGHEVSFELIDDEETA